MTLKGGRKLSSNFRRTRVIRKIQERDVIDCIVMARSQDQEYAHTHDYNELHWVNHFTRVVNESLMGNGHYLAIADYSEDNKLQGFLTASSYINNHTGKYAMDVNDCVVPLDNPAKNVYIVSRLYDGFFEHIKKHSGKEWSASSIRDNGHAERYINFLHKRYNGNIYYAIRGVVEK
jgi:hypothetical protein